MRHVLFEESDKYPLAILIKTSALHQLRMEQHYVDPLVSQGVSKGDLIGFSLEYNSAGKAPAKLQKEYLAKLLPALDSLGTTTLLVADGGYFKTLTKVRKVDPHYGYVMPCALAGFEHFNVILLPNYQGLVYNPDLQKKIDLGLSTAANQIGGTYRPIGADIVHSEHYPETISEIAAALEKLHQYPALTADIEAFSLTFWEAGIGTIGFAWDQHNGLAFDCDYTEFTTTDPFKKFELLGITVEIEPEETEEAYLLRCQQIADQYYGYQKANPAVRQLIREFFESYQGELTLIWHNANYDLKVLVYVLWMNSLLDERGKQKGIEVMTRHFHDTKLITYLATNSTAGNRLSLKDQAHEFAGNWAQSDIKDIRLIPKPALLRYNLVDCLSTWYVYNKHYQTMLDDQQEEIYNTIMKPSVKVILQMELTGMPLDMAQVKKTKVELNGYRQQHLSVLLQSQVIQSVEDLLTKLAWQKDYTDRRDKAKNPDKIQPKDRDMFPRVDFNPNSNPQLQTLLYDHMQLPVIDRTDTKQPATGGKTLKKLINHTQNPDYTKILEALIGFFEVDKILGTFIKAFEENSVQKGDGWWYLHGNFNLGGTVSGRLSSSGPNLQNIPSTGSKYAKPIKKCFKAPPGWLFCGADFASLEDRISALTTKDPQKLKVYTDGFDGHCLRAHAYFGDQMPDIDPTSVESINSIAKKYKPLRQDSKVPTFALTYQGTWHTLVSNLGLHELVAKSIEANYHELYKVSDEWVANKIQQAAQSGYVTVAFGLRVRTPMLAKVIWNSSSVPYEAKAESRTAGNALGQSYGLLNNRAGIDLQERTIKSEHTLGILPSAHIHDAQYFIVKDDIDVVEWLNTNLGECMLWQNLPEIYHPDVPLGGELDIFHPTWADDYTLPNGADQKTIRNICSGN